MDEDIKKLLEAQQIDMEIDKLRKYKNIYPAQIAALEGEIAAMEQDLRDTIAAIQKDEINNLTIESEMGTEKERLTSREQRLLITKTNKEYTAVQHEIILSRERVDLLENEGLAILTELDQLKPRKVEIEQNLEETRNANREKIAEIDEKFRMLESDIAVLERKSERALDGVSSRALNVYNRLRRSKSGIAISLVDPARLSCRGCCKQLPHQKILELRRHDKMMFCENCGRILYWSDNE